ncbi:MAG: tetratricopeptide repeat protein [Cyanobacteria bacterium SIG30]|nr:tetratricopeptide repeat protein [Cyanobacteria bacterium SIG30]
MQETNNKKINKKINKMAQNGKIQKAIELCQSELFKNPDNAELHIKLGDLYMDWHLDIYQAKHYIDEAITQYQIASESLIDNGNIYYKIGFAFFHKGELDRAINYFNLAIKNGAHKGQCHFMLAKTLKKKERYTEALEQTKLALRNSFLGKSKIHYLRHRLLMALYFTNFKTKTRSIFELILSWLTLPFDKEAIKECLNKLVILSTVPAVINAHSLTKIGNLEGAIEIYSELINKLPGYPIFYCLLGNAYKAIGKYDEAIVEFKMARWIDSLCFEAYTKLAQTYEEMGDYENAISTYQKFIKIHPNSAILHSNIANLYFMKGDTATAISHYQSAISLNPNKNFTSSVCEILGYIEQNVARNTDAAISAFQGSYLITPEAIDIYVNLGSAFYDKEDYDNALIIYRHALELDPNNAKIHCNLGYLHWGMGDINEAIKEYELSIKNDPNYDIAHNNLGVIYLDDLAHISKAVECFENAIKANPNYALAYYNLARSLNIKGEKIEAAKYYQIAYDVNTITQELDPAEIQERLNNLFD